MLTSRLIDRPIRPLFPEGFRNETQVVATVLSHDLENDPDIVAHDRLLGGADASPAFRSSARSPRARVGYIDGQYVLNPTLDADASKRSSTSSSPAPPKAC